MSDTPMFLNLMLFVLGLVIIIKGSDLFLDNAVWIAKASGVPQIIIGATIVSVCTTVPELVSSATASLKGTADMAVGNAIGSIICNSGLILGVMLLFITARADREVFLVKGSFMIGAIIAAFFLIVRIPALTGQGGPPRLERAHAAVLLVLLVIYLVVNYYESLHTATDEPLPVDPPGDAPEPESVAAEAAKGEWRRRLVFFVAGGVFVGVGAYLLIEFGQRLARNFKISEAVISVVFVAFGTSLPELFTAVSAVRKKAEQISVGNIFGANVLNIVMVLGMSGTIRPFAISDEKLAYVDIPVALGLCSLAFAGGLIRGRIGRGTGLLLVGGYVTYLISMLLSGRVG